MSTTSKVNVKELAIQRDQDDRPRIAPKRRIVSRVVLPAVMIVSFLSVLAWAARDVYLPRTSVTVIPVRMSLSELQAEGTPLYNAAGWVEPRPTPTRVAALASGVVEELLVVEDQFVTAGEPIASLVDDDATLALEQAQATLELRKAEIQEADAGVEAARVNFDIPAHLELPVAEAEAALAAIETELSNLPHQIKQADARLRFATYDLKTKQALGNVATQTSIEAAQSEQDAAAAGVVELTNRRVVLVQHQRALRRQVAAAAKRLELKTDEQHAFKAAEAQLMAARSRLKQAEVAIAEAELRLSRMTIHAPVEGRILNLVTQPGSHLMGSAGSMQGEDRSTVVKMYSPDQLQVRVDVRFEDLPKTGRGQPVEIRSPAIATPLKGTVLFLTGFANIQKNTLEVKVSIEDPPEVLKPEMLVDVTFLAPDAEAPIEENTEEYRLFIPRALVAQDGEANFVWVADVANQVARRQPVSVSKQASGTFIEVTGGLTAASRIIASGYEQLNDGDRIRITDETTIFDEETTSASHPQRFPDEAHK
ncbi:Multidrug resistance protein MdtA precursor [Symmachiella macrocystis]|uniref:Multidrug resistance protein MdtA n=1 Tax=Symmachiella macrocystis TaxID=2527985 RepID=A0A5C6AZ44_9PLAN|nr:HlyD family efflux transporter periplasmic adaptor subunit [Symmachiella macrocystis]TWU05253.1 Multidrug resistance protein MdtA precursor [Symmachiella macrocystis]